MNPKLRPLAYWRTWLRLASAAFSVSLLTVLLGRSTLATAFGPPVLGVLQSAVQWGFYASIAFFFVAFACLARRQAQNDG